MNSHIAFESKKSRALALMKKKGMWPSLYAPPCHVFLWELGISVAPPPFSPFWTNFACITGVNTTFWGIVMWFVFWKGNQEDLLSATWTILTVGVLCGLFMSALESWRGKANNLPPWSEV
ncbi:DUF6404 family protein [Erwinia sp. BNK-24-b]|uniref:DUF6404 family protein n=1 Tax=Erwinia TaxID=551 RepID=UPI0039BFB748